MKPPFPFPLKYSEGVIAGGLDWGTVEGLGSWVLVGAFSFEGDTGFGAAAGLLPSVVCSGCFFLSEGVASSGFSSPWGVFTFGVAGGSALAFSGHPEVPR